MVNTVVLSSKGQLVIPKSIRNILGIHSGSELMLELRDEVLEIHRVKGDISKFFGLGKSASSSTDVHKEDIDDLISKAVIDNDRY